MTVPALCPLSCRAYTWVMTSCRIISMNKSKYVENFPERSALKISETSAISNMANAIQFIKGLGRRAAVSPGMNSDRAVI